MSYNSSLMIFSHIIIVIYSFYTETVHVSRAASMLKSVIDSQDSSYQISVDGMLLGINRSTFLLYMYRYY